MGRRPQPIPFEQIPAYTAACAEIIKRLASDEILFPLEIDFILAVSEHAENCVFWYNGVLREDTEMSCGAERLMRRFWQEWDRAFGSIATKREMKDLSVALRWQHQLYVLRLFSETKHFMGVCDQPGAPPTDPRIVWQREAQEVDLRRIIAEVISQEGLAKEISLPTLPKAA
jgi:hypothetical protein